MPFCLQCPGRRFFKDDKALQVHIESRRHFQCRRCARSFTTKKGRSYHEMAKHATHFGCRHCPTGFPSNAALQQHQLSSHHFVCHICGYVLPTMEALAQHEESMPHYRCSHCHVLRLFTQDSKSAHEWVCSLNPVNLAIKAASAMAHSNPPFPQSDLVQSNDTKSRGIVEEEVTTWAIAQHPDEGSWTHLSPHLSWDLELEKGEALNFTSGISSANASGEDVTVEQPDQCTHSLKSGRCPVFQKKPPTSANADKPTPDSDARNVVATNDICKDNSIKISRDMFQCTPCLQMFETEEAFQDHACPASATGPRFNCPICYIAFDDRTLLQEHMECAQAFICQLCRTSCCSDELMQDHLLSHPACNKCGKSFVDNLALCAHLESDHPVVVCWGCDGIAIDKDNLESHYTDSPEYPSCVLCSIGKRDSADMDEHVEDVHGSSADVEDQREGGTIDHQASPQVPLAEDQSPVEGREEAVRQPAEVDRTPSPVVMEIMDTLSDHEPADGLRNRTRQTKSPLPLSPQPSMSPQVEHADERVEVFDAGPHKHNERASGISLPSYHCRSCYKDHCEEPTMTTCGHLFCYECITTAVMDDSRCPVCDAPTLLYCLFRIDMSA